MYDESGHLCYPPLHPLSHYELDPSGVYLLDACRSLYLWIGENAPQPLVAALLERQQQEHIERADNWKVCLGFYFLRSLCFVLLEFPFVSFPLLHRIPH